MKNIANKVQLKICYRIIFFSLILFKSILSGDIISGYLIKLKANKAVTNIGTTSSTKKQG